MRTATALLSLTLLATPASSEAWLGPGFPPARLSWLTGDQTKANGVMPEWFWWTWGWETVDKWVTTAWPDPPKPRVAGDPRIRLMPPLEFDHPYTGPGKLTVIHAASQDEVRQKCPGTLFPKAGAYGCAISHQGGCTVVTASVADMKAVGLTMDITMRHETAHCNGWPGDHRGALPIEDWALGWESLQ
jgi:hypothetical protein